MQKKCICCWNYNENQAWNILSKYDTDFLQILNLYRIAERWYLALHIQLYRLCPFLNLAKIGYVWLVDQP